MSEHKGLVVASDTNVYLVNEKGKFLLADPTFNPDNHGVYDVEIHNGKIYAALYNRKNVEGQPRSTICSVLDGNTIAEREDATCTLCSYRGMLLDGGVYPLINESFGSTRDEGRFISLDNGTSVYELCEHNGSLYFSLSKKGKRGGEIHKNSSSLSTLVCPTEYERWVLGSFNGELYDVVNHKDTLRRILLNEFEKENEFFEKNYGDRNLVFAEGSNVKVRPPRLKAEEVFKTSFRNLLHISDLREYNGNFLAGTHAGVIFDVLKDPRARKPLCYLGKHSLITGMRPVSGTDWKNFVGSFKKID